MPASDEYQFVPLKKDDYDKNSATKHNKPQTGDNFKLNDVAKTMQGNLVKTGKSNTYKSHTKEIRSGMYDSSLRDIRSSDVSVNLRYFRKLQIKASVFGQIVVLSIFVARFSETINVASFEKTVLIDLESPVSILFDHL